MVLTFELSSRLSLNKNGNINEITDSYHCLKTLQLVLLQCERLVTFLTRGLLLKYCDYTNEAVKLPYLYGYCHGRPLNENKT